MARRFSTDRTRTRVLGPTRDATREAPDPFERKLRTTVEPATVRGVEPDSAIDDPVELVVMADFAALTLPDWFMEDTDVVR